MTDPLLLPWTAPGRAGPMIVRGEGCWVWDTSGRRYLDARSGALNASCGHAHPAVTAAIDRQASKLGHYELIDAANQPSHDLAAVLDDRLPGAGYRVLFTNSGSEAVEAAVRAAVDYQQSAGGRREASIIALDVGYHGSTALTLALSGLPQTVTPYRSPLPVHHLQVPLPPSHLRSGAGLRDLAEALQVILANHANTIAALIVEPLINLAGCLPLAPGTLQMLRQACDAIGALFIVDEVFTGLGRTGQWFGVNHDDVGPDIVVLSKGLASGVVPIAATAIAAPVADALETGIRYGHTTSGHALACAAALATIDVLDAEKLPRNAQVRGHQLLTQLAPLIEGAAVTDVRGLGLATGIELASPTDARRVAEVCQHAGALVRVQSSTVVSAPPLTISTSEVDHLAGIVTSAVETAARDASHQEPRS